MTKEDQIEHEAAQIVMAAVAGEASIEDLERLNEMLLEHPELCSFVVDIMSQDSWLMWNRNQSLYQSEAAGLSEQMLEAVFAAEPTLIDREPERSVAPGKERSGVSREAKPLLAKLSFMAAAILLLAIGALIGGGSVYWSQNQKRSREVVALEKRSEPSSINFVGRLIPYTPCVLGAAQEASLAPRDLLLSGEMLSIQEGLAEIQLSWDAMEAVFKIEGPAGLILAVDRGASLSHGKFMVDVQALDKSFCIDTTAGQIMVTGEASLGIDISSGSTELHLFRGDAVFLAHQTKGTAATERHWVSEGSSLKVNATAIKGRDVQSGVASREGFTSQMSMGSDRLMISDEYVAEVLKKKPVLYWRFDDSSPRTVSSVVGDRYRGQFVGAVERKTEDSSNRSIEFGVSLNPAVSQAYLYCDEPFDDLLTDSYSIELWVKPNHYHRGVIVAMIDDSQELNQHGLIIELESPSLPGFTSYVSNKVRFLHRSPAGRGNTGTNCYSDSVYDVRRWQHIVAVKEGKRMRLHVDGEIVSEKDDSSPMSKGLKLLVGKLERGLLRRQFVGQIDELAVYDEALTVDQIKRHYRLVRPQDPPGSEANLPSKRWDLKGQRSKSSGATPTQLIGKPMRLAKPSRGSHST